MNGMILMLFEWVLMVIWCFFWLFLMLILPWKLVNLTYVSVVNCMDDNGFSRGYNGDSPVIWEFHTLTFSTPNKSMEHDHTNLITDVRFLHNIPGLQTGSIHLLKIKATYIGVHSCLVNSQFCLGTLGLQTICRLYKFPWHPYPSCNRLRSSTTRFV